MATLTLRPNADGTVALTCSSGTTHNTLVNESVTDDGTYVYGSGASLAYDLLGMPNHTSEAGLITNVRVYGRFYATASGTGNGVLGVYLGSTRYNGTAVNVTTSYLDTYVDFATNPAGGAWTWQNIDDLQLSIGCKRPSSSNSTRCTQAWVVVTYAEDLNVTVADNSTTVGEAATVSVESLSEPDGYEVQRKVGAGEFAKIASGVAASPYDDSDGLVDGTTYTYRVRLWASGVAGDWSNEAQVVYSMAALSVTASESTGVTDTVAILPGTLLISAGDGVSVAEAATVSLGGFPETFEAESGWQVTAVTAGTGTCARSNEQAHAGTYSAKCFTTAATDVGYVRDTSWTDDFDSIGANDKYHWQRAYVYLPSATANAITGSEYLDIAGHWQSDGGAGWFLRIKAGAAMYARGFGVNSAAYGDFNLYGTFPVDQWVEVEIGLRSRNDDGTRRSWMVLVNGKAYGWFRRGNAAQGDKNYNRCGFGVISTNSADDLTVYVDDWYEPTTATTPTGTDNRPTASSYTLDYTDQDGGNVEYHQDVWNYNNLTLDATYGLYPNIDGGRCQSGINTDRMPDLSDGWTEIGIEWPGGTVPPWPPVGWADGGDVLFGPMVAFRKRLEDERNLEVQFRYSGGTVTAEYHAWAGSIVVFGSWALPNDAGAGNHPLPGRGDKLRVRWQETSATNLRARVDYYDASAGTWTLDAIDTTDNVSNVGLDGLNFLGDGYRAVCNTQESNDYSITYQTTGVLSTFPTKDINVTDSGTIADSVAVKLGGVLASAAENSTNVTEAVKVTPGAVRKEVTENNTLVTDAVTVRPGGVLVTAAENSTTVADAPTVRPGTVLMAGSDGANITDTVGINVGAAPDVNLAPAEGNTNVTDSVAVLLGTVKASAGDGAAVSDTVAIRPDTVKMDGGDGANVTDAVTVTPLSAGVVYITASDGLTVADAPTVKPGTVLLGAADTVTLADSPAVSVGAAPPVNVAVSDGAQVAEAVGVWLSTLSVNVTDAVAVAEVAAALLPDTVLLAVAENIGALDAATVNVLALVTALRHWTLLGRASTWTLDNRDTDVSLRSRATAWTLETIP